MPPLVATAADGQGDNAELKGDSAGLISTRAGEDSAKATGSVRHVGSILTR